MKIKHTSILAKFTAKFSPEAVNRWNAMVEAWDTDQEKPNPYEEEFGKGMFISMLLDIYFNSVSRVNNGTSLP